MAICRKIPREGGETSLGRASLAFGRSDGGSSANVVTLWKYSTVNDSDQKQNGKAEETYGTSRLCRSIVYFHATRRSFWRFIIRSWQFFMCGRITGSVVVLAIGADWSASVPGRRGWITICYKTSERLWYRVIPITREIDGHRWTQWTPRKDRPSCANQASTALAVEMWSSLFSTSLKCVPPDRYIFRGVMVKQHFKDVKGWRWLERIFERYHVELRRKYRAVVKLDYRFKLCPWCELLPSHCCGYTPLSSL